MDPDIEKRLQEIEAKIEVLSRALEKKKSASKVFLIVAVAAFVLPLIGLLFAVPKFLSYYANLGDI